MTEPCDTTAADMQTRTLPPREWARLAETDLAEVWPKLSPDTDAVVVVEDDGQILGCLAFVVLAHTEGLWVHPAHRQKTAVLRHLYYAARDFVAAHQTSTVLTGAATPEMAAIMDTLGATPLPVTLYVWPEVPSCRPS